MAIIPPTYQATLRPLTLITRRRELPFAGEILVRAGQRVEPEDVIGRTLIPARGQRFRVARALGIDPAELGRSLVLADGSELQVGDVVVETRRGRPRVWRAPIAGTLSTVEVDRGYLVIFPPAELLEVRAHFKGFVVSVEPYRAAVIQTPAALVQGVFGLGGVRHGVMRVAVTDPADELTPETMDERLAFCILIAGAGVSAEVLARAVELQVRGIIVGSIAEEALRSFLGYGDVSGWQVGAVDWAFPPDGAQRSFPLTLIVTEGFGHHPMCRRTFELLASHDGAEVAVDGRTCLHGPGLQRPEVVIPLPRANVVSEPEESLLPGTEVRLLSHTMLGRVGKIVDLPRAARPLLCGARARVAEVELEDGSLVEVPVENLEILEAGGPEETN
jgi:hypothetical protein